jgi:hypothetical protein
MGTRLESIMAEDGTPMEALLGADGNADTPWRLDVKSFRLPGYQPPESPKTAAADCMKNSVHFTLFIRALCFYVMLEFGLLYQF